MIKKKENVIENADDLFMKPLHKEINCPWTTEDSNGNIILCPECEHNEMLNRDIESDASWLVESGVTGVRNQQEEAELGESWVEAMNIIVRERKEGNL